MSKVLIALMLPPACHLLLLLAGLAIMRKHPGCGKLLAVLAMLSLYLLGLPLASDTLIRPLESAYPPFNGKPGNAQAVVVLSGGVRDLSWVPAPPGPEYASLARVVYGVELARAFRLPLVITGGSGAIDRDAVREADAMAGQAIRLGFPAKDVLIENRSRNTLESSRAVRALLVEENIILVTSAFHMRRSAAMFRKQGFEVIPAPTAYLSQTPHASWTNLLPTSGSLDTSSRAIAERLSLTWYRLIGAL